MSINTFTASGNLGNDCEVRYTKNSKAIASFNLPVKQGFGDYEKTSWVTCKLLGKRAEGSLPQYLRKGTKVLVSGEFVLEQWQGENGENKSRPVIIVNQLDFAGAVSNDNPPAKPTPHKPLEQKPFVPSNNDGEGEHDVADDDVIPF